MHSGVVWTQDISTTAASAPSATGSSAYLIVSHGFIALINWPFAMCYVLP
jgi:hypothetical protein